MTHNDSQVEARDDFNGDTPHLIRCIEALLRIDKAGALFPHGIGGHARTLLSAAACRLAALSALAAGKQEAWIPSSERLPAKDVEVLTYDSSADHVFVNQWCDWWEAPVSFSSKTICVGEGWETGEFENITHWMPLPASPSPLCVDPESAGTGGQAGTFADKSGTFADTRGTFADPERMRAWEEAGRRIQAEDEGLPAAAPERRECDGGVALEMSREEADALIEASDGHTKMSEVRDLVQEAFRRGVAAALGVALPDGAKR